MWVFTYVPAGETIKVRDSDVGIKPLVKEYDVLQGHVLDSHGPDGQFIRESSVGRFLNETADLDTPRKVKEYFRVRKDSISLETLRTVREWVSREDKGHKVQPAN